MSVAGWSPQVCTAGYLSVHPMAQCVVHALNGLACRAPVLLAHAEVTKNSTGPKLRYPAVPRGQPSHSTQKRSAHALLIEHIKYTCKRMHTSTWFRRSLHQAAFCTQWRQADACGCAHIPQAP